MLNFMKHITDCMTGQICVFYFLKWIEMQGLDLQITTPDFYLSFLTKMIIALNLSA